MFGYATDMRNMTQGRGSFTMEFEKYSPAPQFIAEEVIKGKLRKFLPASTTPLQ